MDLRKKILAIDDVKTDTVYVDEWECTVKVRSLTSQEMERWWDIVNDHVEKGVDPPGGRQASFVFMGAINDDGTPLFKPEDVPLLGEKSPNALSRIFDAIYKVSGMSSEAKAEIEKKPEVMTNSLSTGSVTAGESQTLTA